MISWPAAVLRSSAMLFLLRLMTRKYWFQSPTGSALMLRTPRPWSPPFGRSTLMTSAPKSARCCAATGPWNQTVRSITRRPSSALVTAPSSATDRASGAERRDLVLGEPEHVVQYRGAVLTARRCHPREARGGLAHEDREAERGLLPVARVVDLDQ